MADENFDDFCLPDDVLNEMMALADAQSAPHPAAAAALPPPAAVPPPLQPYQALALPQPQSNMFDAFHPPGPLASMGGSAGAPPPPKPLVYECDASGKPAEWPRICASLFCSMLIDDEVNHPSS